MTDIKSMSIEDFIHTAENDIQSLKNCKIRVKEFKFFTNSTMVYDDYYFLVGPRGGLSLYYGKNKKINIGWDPIINCDPGVGIKYNAPSAWGPSLVLPSIKSIPRILSELEQDLVTTVKQYKKTYTNAEKRLKEIQKLSKEYPEYSL